MFDTASHVFGNFYSFNKFKFGLWFYMPKQWEVKQKSKNYGGIYVCTYGSEDEVKPKPIFRKITLRKWISFEISTLKPNKTSYPQFITFGFWAALATWGVKFRLQIPKWIGKRIGDGPWEFGI